MPEAPGSRLNSLHLFHRIPAPLLNGLSIGAGLLVNTGLVGLGWGPQAAAVASSGFGAVSVADTVCTPRAKLAAMLPALVSSLVVSALVGLSAGHALAQAALALVVTFVALLWSAWGKRGLPQSFVMILSLVFQMAAFSQGPPMAPEALLTHLAWVAQGGLAMVAWSLLSSLALASRYRALALAEGLDKLSRVIQLQAEWTHKQGESRQGQGSDMLPLIAHQAALADVFQNARDLLYSQAARSDNHKLQTQIRALIELINVRDSAMACQLDIEPLLAQSGSSQHLHEVAHVLTLQAQALARMALSIKLDKPMPAEPETATQSPGGRPRSSLQDGLWRRVDQMVRQCKELSDLLQGRSATPPLAAMLDTMVSPLAWPTAPLRSLWHGHSPTLRYAIRTTLAMACALLISHQLPWSSHPHWLLMTVAVVMRGNLEQTLARRDARILGTLVGCIVASLLLWLHMPAPALYVVLALAMGAAHGHVQLDYRITAASGAVLALTQTHLLSATQAHAMHLLPVWQDAAIRMADTLIGAALAWGFSYVLPSWERRQMPQLVQGLQRSLLSHAIQALNWQGASDPSPARHHARREVYDRLWMMAQALQRSRKEPRAAQWQAEPMENLLIHSHRLVGQLAGVRMLLLHRHAELSAEETRQALALTDEALRRILGSVSGASPRPQTAPALMEAPPLTEGLMPMPALDPQPWLARRLRFIQAEASAWRSACDQIMKPEAPSHP
jgi:uncharacterized membrane protein YccC